MKRVGTGSTNTKNNSIKKAASDIIDSKKPSGKKDVNTILTTNAQSGVRKAINKAWSLVYCD